MASRLPYYVYMILHVCENEKQWVQKIDELLRLSLGAAHVRRLFIPAGETPRPLYKSWEQKHPDFLTAIRLVQVDEVLEGEKVFKNFFQFALPNYLHQFEWIEQAESGADAALLGLGKNGHVAFHEPKISRDFYSGCVELDELTCTNLNLPARTHGITYGLGAFMRCQFILLLVRGVAKREILKRVLNEDPALPASHLLKHKTLHIVTDFPI